jgi:uncharacterized protein (DUF4415 family)
MRKEYDFSNAKRAKDIPYLAKLQEKEEGKTRITIMLDNEVLNNFRKIAKEKGLGYQTLINQTLKGYTNPVPLSEETLRKIIQEELKRT